MPKNVLRVLPPTNILQPELQLRRLREHRAQRRASTSRNRRPNPQPKSLRVGKTRNPERVHSGRRAGGSEERLQMQEDQMSEEILRMLQLGQQVRNVLQMRKLFQRAH